MAEFQTKSAALTAGDGPKAPLLYAELFPLPDGSGKIFALIKILGRRDETREKIIETIQDQLKRFQETLDAQTNIARRFEQVLQAVNEQVATVLENGKRVPTSDFHAVLGVTHKQQVFLAGAGNLTTLFMHRTAKQRYSIYELDEQFTRGENLTWQKPFITVLDGELNPGDVLYVATRVSARDISIAELQDILVMLPPSGALERIQQHLKIGTPFASVCFRVNTPESKNKPKKVNPLHSIEHLGNTREDTAQTLGEQSPDFASWIQRRITPIITKLSSPGTKGWKTILKRILKTIIKILAAIAVFIHTAGKRLWQTLRAFAGGIWRLYKRGRSHAQKEQDKQPTKEPKKRFAQLPKPTKYVAIGIVVVILLLVGSVFYNGNRKQKREADETFTQTVQLIEEKRDAAQASLIYQDDEQARDILNEALALLETLQTSTKGQEDEITRLQSELNQVFEELQGISDVALTNLAQLDGETIVDIISTDSGVLAITRGKNIYRFNAFDTTFELVPLTTGSVGNLALATSEGANVILADESNQLARIDIATGSLNPITSGLADLSGVEDIASYNGNVYALVAAEQQIYRMRPQVAGFDAGSTWITANSIDIKTARSLAVDGDIYVLTSSQIVKYTTGAQQDLRIDPVDPALSNPIQIWTDISSERLYVLEPANRRIVVYEKNGNFLTQYTSPEFENAVAIHVQENENQILVATGSTLLSFQIEQQ